jgi:hypothetical protein
VKSECIYFDIPIRALHSSAKGTVACSTINK